MTVGDLVGVDVAFARPGGVGGMTAWKALSDAVQWNDVNRKKYHKSLLFFGCRLFLLRLYSLINENCVMENVKCHTLALMAVASK